jgi:hypothetical protein
MHYFVVAIDSCSPTPPKASFLPRVTTSVI